MSVALPARVMVAAVVLCWTASQVRAQVCSQGYYWDGLARKCASTDHTVCDQNPGACVACPAGKFNSRAGDGQCFECESTSAPSCGPDIMENGCPDGWLSFEQKCYKYSAEGQPYWLWVPTTRDWHQAHAFCASMGATMAIIQNAAEGQFLINHADQHGHIQRFWVNLYWQETDPSNGAGEWRHYDGSVATYSNFCPDFNWSSNYKWIALTHDGCMMGHNFDGGMNFFCEKPKCNVKEVERAAGVYRIDIGPQVNSDAGTAFSKYRISNAGPKTWTSSVAEIDMYSDVECSQAVSHAGVTFTCSPQYHSGDAKACSTANLFSDDSNTMFSAYGHAAYTNPGDNWVEIDFGTPTVVQCIFAPPQVTNQELYCGLGVGGTNCNSKHTGGILLEAWTGTEWHAIGAPIHASNLVKVSPMAAMPAFCRNLARSCGVGGKSACPASQSSNLNADTPAGEAVDGIIMHPSVALNNDYSHTSNSDSSPWWQLDFETSRTIASIRIWDRSDVFVFAGHWLESVTIRIGDSATYDDPANTICYTGPGLIPPCFPYGVANQIEECTVLNIPCVGTGRYLSFAIPAGNIILMEVQVSASAVLCDAVPLTTAAIAGAADGVKLARVTAHNANHVAGEIILSSTIPGKATVRFGSGGAQAAELRSYNDSFVTRNADATHELFFSAGESVKLLANNFLNLYSITMDTTYVEYSLAGIGPTYPGFQQTGSTCDIVCLDGFGTPGQSPGCLASSASLAAFETWLSENSFTASYNPESIGGCTCMYSVEVNTASSITPELDANGVPQALCWSGNGGSNAWISKQLPPHPGLVTAKFGSWYGGASPAGVKMYLDGVEVGWQQNLHPFEMTVAFEPNQVLTIRSNDPHITVYYVRVTTPAAPTPLACPGISADADGAVETLLDYKKLNFGGLFSYHDFLHFCNQNDLTCRFNDSTIHGFCGPPCVLQQSGGRSEYFNVDKKCFHANGGMPGTQYVDVSVDKTDGTTWTGEVVIWATPPGANDPLTFRYEGRGESSVTYFNHGDVMHFGCHGAHDAVRFWHGGSDHADEGYVETTLPDFAGELTVKYGSLNEKVIDGFGLLNSHADWCAYAAFHLPSSGCYFGEWSHAGAGAGAEGPFSSAQYIGQIWMPLPSQFTSVEVTYGTKYGGLILLWVCQKLPDETITMSGSNIDKVAHSCVLRHDTCGIYLISGCDNIAGANGLSASNNVAGHFPAACQDYSGCSSSSTWGDIPVADRPLHTYTNNALTGNEIIVIEEDLSVISKNMVIKLNFGTPSVGDSAAEILLDGVVQDVAAVSEQTWTGTFSPGQVLRVREHYSTLQLFHIHIRQPATFYVTDDGARLGCQRPAVSSSSPSIVYDFTNYPSEATWLAYTALIGVRHNLIDVGEPANRGPQWAHGGFYNGYEVVGYVEFDLPTGFNFVTVRYGSVTTDSGSVKVKLNGVVVSSTTPATIQEKTFSTFFNTGDVLRVEEDLALIKQNLRIIIENKPTAADLHATDPIPQPCHVKNLARMCGPRQDEQCSARASSEWDRGGGTVYSADKAIDGLIDVSGLPFSTAHNPEASNVDYADWWIVDMGRSRDVSHVRIWHGEKSSMGGFDIRIGDSSVPGQNPLCIQNAHMPDADHTTLSCVGIGRYLEVRLEDSGGYNDDGRSNDPYGNAESGWKHLYWFELEIYGPSSDCGCEACSNPAAVGEFLAPQYRNLARSCRNLARGCRNLARSCGVLSFTTKWEHDTIAWEAANFGMTPVGKLSRYSGTAHDDNHIGLYNSIANYPAAYGIILSDLPVTDGTISINFAEGGVQHGGPHTRLARNCGTANEEVLMDLVNVGNQVENRATWSGHVSAGDTFCIVEYGSGVDPILTVDLWTAGNDGTKACGATMSSGFSYSGNPNSYPAFQAVDGLVYGDPGGLGATTGTEHDTPWIRIDFGVSRKVKKFVISHRIDCCWHRLDYFKVSVGNSTDLEQNPVCYDHGGLSPREAPWIREYPCDGHGRYLFVWRDATLVSGSNDLELHEIQVYGDDAFGASGTEACGTELSSTWEPYTSELAVDNNYDNLLNAQPYSCVVSGAETSPWWSVDFVAERSVTLVRVQHRGEHQGRGDNLKISIGNSPNFGENPVCHEWAGVSPRDYPYFSWHDCVGTGRYMHIYRTSDSNIYLELCEVEVYGPDAASGSQACPAQVSSTYAQDQNAMLAVDGTHDSTGMLTSHNLDNPTWWRLNFITPRTIHTVRILWWDDNWNRMEDFKISIGDSPSLAEAHVCYSHIGHAWSHPETDFKNFPCVGHGQYVFVWLPRADHLHLIEVQALGLDVITPGGFYKNLARSCGLHSNDGCPAAFSAQANAGTEYASWVVDGDVTSRGSASNGQNPTWFRVDLQSQHHIHTLGILHWERYTSRFDDFKISVGNSLELADCQVCYSHAGTAWIEGENDFKYFPCHGRGRYVYVWLDKAEYLVLEEVQVFGYDTPTLTECDGDHCPGTALLTSEHADGQDACVAAPAGSEVTTNGTVVCMPGHTHDPELEIHDIEIHAKAGATYPDANKFGDHRLIEVEFLGANMGQWGVGDRTAGSHTVTVTSAGLTLLVSSTSHANTAQGLAATVNGNTVTKEAVYWTGKTSTDGSEQLKFELTGAANKPKIADLEGIRMYWQTCCVSAEWDVYVKDQHNTLHHVSTIKQQPSDIVRYVRDNNGGTEWLYTYLYYFYYEHHFTAHAPCTSCDADHYAAADGCVACPAGTSTDKAIHNDQPGACGCAAGQGIVADGVNLQLGKCMPGSGLDTANDYSHYQLFGDGYVHGAVAINEYPGNIEACADLCDAEPACNWFFWSAGSNWCGYQGPDTIAMTGVYGTASVGDFRAVGGYKLYVRIGGGRKALGITGAEDYQYVGKYYMQAANNDLFSPNLDGEVVFQGGKLDCRWYGRSDSWNNHNQNYFPVSQYPFPESTHPYKANCDDNWGGWSVTLEVCFSLCNEHPRCGAFYYAKHNGNHGCYLFDIEHHVQTGVQNVNDVAFVKCRQHKQFVKLPQAQIRNNGCNNWGSDCQCRGSYSRHLCAALCASSPYCEWFFFSDAAETSCCIDLGDLKPSGRYGSSPGDFMAVASYGGAYRMIAPTCTACADGKYNPSAGRTDLCALCPATMVSVDSSASKYCVCGPGLYLSNGACVACPQSTYKSTNANASTGCALHSVEEPCCQCSSFKDTVSNASTDITDCKCVSGYGAASPTDECTACAIGTFREGLASETCESCSSDGTETTALTASVSEDLCVCSAGYYEATIAVGDITGATPTWVEHGPGETVHGKYGYWYGGDTSVESIVARINEENAQHSGSYIPYTLMLTDTDPDDYGGYGYEVTWFVYFDSPTWNGGTNDAIVLDSTQIAYQLECPTGSALSKTAQYDDSYNFECAALTASVTCQPCANGTYQSAIDATACDACPLGSTSGPASTSVHDCLCTLPGYAGTVANGGCSCASGFSRDSGTGECVTCPAGSICYGENGPERVEATVELGVSLADWTANNLEAAFKSAIAARLTIDTGKSVFSSQVIIDSVTQVSANARRLLSGSIQVDFTVTYFTLTGSPTATEVDSALTESNIDAAIAASSDLTLSSATSTLTEDASVVGGDTGTTSTRSSDTSSYTADAAVSCPEHMTAPEGVASIAECDCNAGYYHSADPLVCVECAAGTYQPAIGQSTCIDCDANAQSPAGSVISTACLCNAGFSGPDGGTCTVCAIGSYKDEPGSAGCEACNAVSQTTVQTASTEPSACDCKSGFGLDHDSFHLITCLYIDATLVPKSVYADSELVILPAVENFDHLQLTTWGPNGENVAVSGVYGRWLDSSRGQLQLPSFTLDATNPGGMTFFIRIHQLDWNKWEPFLVLAYGSGNGLKRMLELKNAGGNDLSNLRNRGWLSFRGQNGCTTQQKYFDKPFNQGPISFYFGTDADGVKRFRVRDDSYTIVHEHVVSDTWTCSFLSAPGYDTVGAWIGHEPWTNMFAMSIFSHVWLSSTHFPEPTLQEMNCAEGCQACDTGSYKPDIGDETCTTCPDNSATATTGSLTATSCLCNAGYTGPDGGACTVCPAGTFKDTPGSAACTNCPAGADSPAGSTAVTACLCQPGYYHDGATAEYDCATCASDTYQPDPGQNGCIDCAANSQAAAGSTALTDCKCNAGYTGDDGMTCFACAEGKYKDAPGSATCTDCPASSNSPAASDANTDCLCNAGYTGPDGGACSECAAGTYKSSPGSSICTDCLASETTAAAASTAESACVCLAGYGFDGACQPCAESTFKSTIGDDACTPCGEQAFAPAQSTSITACLCNAGYTPVGDNDNGAHDCEACAAGQYKVGVNDDDCSSCPAASTSPTASDALTDCVCNTGYSGADGETCVACTANQYEAANACEDCPANSQSLALSDAVTDCKCNVGYTGPDGGACSACLADQYKDSVGAAACSHCTDFSTSPAASDAIDDCTCNAGYHHAGDGSCDLICAAGFEANAGETKCVGCGPGYYKAAAGDHSCDPCPPNSLHTLRNQTSVDACYCEHGFLADENGDCIQCPAGKFNNQHDDSACFACVQPDGAAPGTHTVCPSLSVAPAGYQADATGDNIELCPVNHYNDGTLRLCEVCPVGTLSALSGLTSVAQCVCQAGYERVGGSCQQCGFGFVKLGDGDGPCDACGAGATTLATGSVEYSACTCLAGHEPVGEACQACGPDYAKFVVSNASCIDCPDASTLQDNGVHAAASCHCNPGYTGPNGGPCSECGSGYYKAEYGPATCDYCGDHTVTPTATATAITDCQCDAPVYEAHADGGPDVGGSCVLSCDPGTTKEDDVCVDCVYGKYKPDIGPGACTACPAPTVASAPGSDAETDCSCPAGFMGLDPLKFVVVETVGPLTLDDLHTATHTGVQAQTIAEDATRRLYDVALTHTTGNTITLTAVVGSSALVLFSCEPRDCQDATVPLWGVRGSLVVAASSPVDLVVRRHSRREFTVVDTDKWDDVELSNAERIVLAENLAPGDHIYQDGTVYSTTHCAACPPTLKCAQYIS